MDSTEQDEESGMDDILDSIRKIISESPINKDSPQTSPDQPEVEEARPASNSTEDDVNITLQLANALGSQRAPDPTHPAPSPGATGPGSATGSIPEDPNSDVMTLTRPLSVDTANPAITGPGPETAPQTPPSPPPSHSIKPGFLDHLSVGLRPGAAIDSSNDAPPRPDLPSVEAAAADSTPGSERTMDPADARSSALNTLQLALEDVSTAPFQTHARPKSAYEPGAAEPFYERNVSPTNSSAGSSSGETEDVVREAAGSERSDMTVRQLLRSMIKTWLDENMPGVVEQVLREEINQVKKSGK